MVNQISRLVFTNSPYAWRHQLLFSWTLHRQEEENKGWPGRSTTLANTPVRKHYLATNVSVGSSQGQRLAHSQPGDWQGRLSGEIHWLTSSVNFFTV